MKSEEKYIMKYVYTLLVSISFAFMNSGAFAATIYVKGESSPGGDGSLATPYNSLQAVEENSAAGDTIILLPGGPMDGGIELKDSQTLIGDGNVDCKTGTCKAKGFTASIKNTDPNSNDGNAIVLGGDDITVVGVEIKEAHANGIFGKNVRNVTLEHNLIKNTNISESNFSCPVDTSSKKLRFLDKTGCGVFGTAFDNFPVSKSAIAIQIADTTPNGMNEIDINFNVITHIAGNGILLTMQGNEEAHLTAHHNLIKDVLTNAPPVTSAGLYVQLYDFAVANVDISDVTIDNLRSRDWFRFFVHILGEKKVGATLIANIKRSQSLNPDSFGPEGNRDGIEALGSADGYILELHVEDSSFVGLPNLGVQLLFSDFFGFPFVPGDSMLLDFGCVNPYREGTTEDRDACIAEGYTSEGRNRIFGNPTDVNLQGLVTLFAQGNWWGTPAEPTNVNVTDGATLDSRFPLAADPQ